MLDISIKELIEITGGKLINGDLSVYGEKHVHNAAFDSRQTDERSVFVPIVGEKVDAHRFISQVLDGDCLVSFTEKEVDYNGDRILILVDSSVRAVQDLAVYCRSKISVPVVAVTGSVGKTTTREMIAAALSAEKKVYSTKGNSNSQIGVPKTIFEFDDDAEIAVLELGMSMPGEMHNLARIARPNAAAFTNIGVTHIENLGSRDAILKEKMHITDFMTDGEMLFLNHDNDMLEKCSVREGLKVSYYGMGKGNDAYVESVDKSSILPRFTANVNGRSVDVQLSVYGQHMIMNALVALMIADHYGIDLEKAAAKLSGFNGYKHREQITVSSGVTVIDDTYNAAPDSMRSAIDVLCEIPCKGRRIAVLADMKELGDIAEAEHINVGRYAKEKGIDALISYGELAIGYTDGFGGTRCHHYDDMEELEKGIYQYVKPGDSVLFKGSNSMKLFDLVDKVLAYEFM